MLELTQDRYNEVLPLIHASGMQGHLAFVYEVLEGRKKGPIFIDDTAQPHTTVICNPTGFFFGFGDYNEDWIHGLVDKLWEKQLEEDLATLYCPKDWVKPLEAFFKARGAAHVSRLAFKRNRWRSLLSYRPVPSGFHLEPLTADLAEKILDGTGTGGFGIDPWFIRVRGGAEGYAEPGLGVALMCNGQIASLCGYCALGNGEAELELGTVPAYRGRGLALITAREFMKQCRKLGWHPAYSCAFGNKPSRAVAKKLGFDLMDKVHGYTLYPAE